MSHSAAQKETSSRLKASKPTPNTTLTQLLKKVDSITENQPNYITRLYKQMAEVNPDNAPIIYDYIVLNRQRLTLRNLQRVTR